jgi:hypothetical protein
MAASYTRKPRTELANARQRKLVEEKPSFVAFGLITRTKHTQKREGESPLVAIWADYKDQAHTKKKRDQPTCFTAGKKPPSSPLVTA